MSTQEKKRKKLYPNPQGEPEIRNSFPLPRACETVPSGRQNLRCYRESGSPGEVRVTLPAFPGLSLPSEQSGVCGHSGGYDLVSVLTSSTARPDI